MCGICGIINKKEKIDSQLLEKINNTMVHRGPDEEGYFIKENIGLGMRRLSIIDLETGKQPISNEDKTVWVIFNGEIYNYVELRKELIKKGHKFSTKTDTEVIVHLYEEKKENFPEYLNGMFAIALWDNKEKKLILTRDRAGEKPLYYGDLNNFFIFASELKAILSHPQIVKEIDLKSLNLYLTLEYVPSPWCIIKGIKKLPPGHTLVLKENKIRIFPYWKIKREIRKGIKLGEAIEILEDLISESVRIRLRSDVPLGIFLSGGIDSSTITYFAKKYIQDVKTFNIAFTEKSFDESFYAKKTAKFLDTEHYEEIFDEGKMLNVLPEVFEFLDEPLGDVSILPTYLLSKFTRNFVKVALGGDGGDELFGGYPTYFAHKISQIYKLLPSFVRNFTKFIGNKLPVSHANFSFDFKVKKFLEGAEENGWKKHIYWMGSFNFEDKEKLFKKDILEDAKIEFEEFIEKTVGFYPGQDIQDYLNFDFKTYLSEDVLFKVDRASMGVSLEVRAPFLDHKLIEFVQSLPERFKVEGWKTKIILKKLMRGKIPDKIIKRGKKGFGIPVAKWIRGKLNSLFREVLLSDNEFFSTSYIGNLIKEHEEKIKDHRKKLWTLFVFIKWKQKYLS